MVRIINETEIEPGEVTMVESNLNGRPLNLNLNRGIGSPTEVDLDIGTNPKVKNNCCTNNSEFMASTETDRGASPEESAESGQGDSKTLTNGSCSESSGVTSSEQTNGDSRLEGCVKPIIPSIVIEKQSNGDSQNMQTNSEEELPKITETNCESQINTKTSSSLVEKSPIPMIPMALSEVKVESLEHLEETEEGPKSTKNDLSDTDKVAESSVKKLVLLTPIVVIENVDEPKECHDDNDKDVKSVVKTEGNKSGDENRVETELEPSVEKTTSEGSDETNESKCKEGNNNSQESENHKETETCIKDKQEDNLEISSTISELSDSSAMKSIDLDASMSSSTTMTPPKDILQLASTSSLPVQNNSNVTVTTATASSVTTTTSKHKGNHHCPAMHHHHHHHNFHFNLPHLSQGAAGHLGNILPRLAHHQHQQHPHHHSLLNSQPGIFHGAPIPPFGAGLGGIHGGPRHQGPPVPFGYFSDQDQQIPPPPWGAFGPLPPLDGMQLPQPPCPLGIGMGSPNSLPSAPLPTAIIPLPLDPNYPPAVLPSYPNTPNTQSTSGYSTAGHSRSSSPMGPTTSGAPGCSQGLLQHLGESPNNCGGGLLPIPPPVSCAASSGMQQVPNPNFVFAAASAELSMFPQLPTVSGQHVVYFHINPGVSVSFSVGDQIQVVKGPMTVPLVSTNSNPPIPLPMQVPPGHVVQQIVDENGTLRHVIVSHQPPLMPIPSYAPSSQAQQFYPPGPGFPSAHFQPMQAGVVPCGVPSPHQGNFRNRYLTGNGNADERHDVMYYVGPPSAQAIANGAYANAIPAYAQKDERTLRQFVKTRRKLEQKQQSTNCYNNNGSYNPGPLLRKETTVYNANGTRKPVANGAPKSPANGGMEEDGSVGSTGSVTSTGTQDEEEENRTLALTEMLSSIIPPAVTEVTARSAYVQWSHPDRISESGENKFPDFDVADTDFRYEVFISEKIRDSRFRSIFVGSALSCRVKDLKPGSMYAITYCAMLGDTKGNTSTPANFTTLPAEPEPPTSPRPVSRSRSSIQFKWNPPASDNGSKVTGFILEYDEGKGGTQFVEAYRGRNKQCTINKLQPALSYQFRIAAINQIGQSRYSTVTSTMTAGSPPTQPAPPTIVEAGVKYLSLEWRARDTDDEYTLQMEDPGTGHGFLPVYNGNAPHYLCIGLKRNSPYKFRLRAQNEEGPSRWSDEVSLSTLPDRPDPPRKPTLKGRVHAYGFKVKWEPPADNGGVPLTAFALEIDQGNGGYEEIYRGTDAEFGVDRLSPGQSYALRAIAVGPGGDSDPSESCVITTEPVCPGKSYIPRIVGKPKSNSVHLKWSPPDWDGGSPVNMYEVGCTTPDNQTQEAYRGKETECVINRLLPGRAYLFQIRAFNRIGAGAWSDPLEVVSGAGAPDSPSAPKLITKTSHIVLVSWTQPLNNGSAVTEYRVQMATPAPATPLENQESEEDKSESKISTETQTDAPVSSFTQVYLGSTPSCEVKGLQPASVYLFRVQAANGAGSSDWSPISSHQMPASSPNTVSGVEVVASSSSISLSWKVPADNGSSITHYNVMIGETIAVAPSNTYVLDNLMPDTHYKIRVQAVNTVGPGAFSSSVKVSTKSLPPPPPKLECVSVAHFWMKLKWSDIPSKNIEYLVQMINPYKDEFEVVYRGINSNCKVTRLTEDTEYQFRICALNGAGQGPFSELYKFCTSKAPPTQVKGCKSEIVKDSRLHRFEWFEVICNDTIEYQFQVANKRREMDFKTMYRGKDRKVEVSHDKLEEGVDYVCRVCAIRLCDDTTQLVGPYSNNVNFQVPVSLREDVISSKSHSASSKSLSTSGQVGNSFFNALEEKMSNISYESRVGIVAVFALIILAFVISLITHHVVS